MQIVVLNDGETWAPADQSTLVTIDPRFEQEVLDFEGDWDDADEAWVLDEHIVTEGPRPKPTYLPDVAPRESTPLPGMPLLGVPERDFKRSQENLLLAVKPLPLDDDRPTTSVVLLVFQEGPSPYVVGTYVECITRPGDIQPRLQDAYSYTLLSEAARAFEVRRT